VVFQFTVQDVVPDIFSQVAPLSRDQITDATPEVASEAVPATVTVPLIHCPEIGLETDELGGVVSIFTCKLLTDSWFPATSVDWYSTVCVPSPETVNADEYVCHVPPSIRYWVVDTPEVLSDAVRVT
jgi:hypothetical protein